MMDVEMVSAAVHLERIVFIICRVLVDYKLYTLLAGKNLRYSKGVTAIIMVSVIILRDILSVNIMYLHSAMNCIWYAIFFICLKENRINGASVFLMICILRDALSSVMLSAVMVGIKLISGESADWITINDLNFAYYGVTAVFVVINSWIAYKICYGFKDRLLELKGILKYILCFLMVGMFFLKDLISSIMEVDYSANPGGFLMVFDVISGMTAIVVCLVMLVRVTVEKRKENKLLKNRMDEERRNYDEVISLRQDLREMNHDLKNYLSVADKIDDEQKNEYKSRIKEYCEKIDEELE